MAAIEKGLQDQMVYDYNQLLPIYPTIDSATFKAAEADLEDVVKKASFPIQYHKNSKWIDDSYVLIGKVRYYQLNFTDAAKTFKYINTNSTNKDTRHEALVWLMRTFLQEKEWDNAWAVSEILRKERLNKANARELYLARAQYHLQLSDTASTIENMALSVPNFDKKDDQSRVRFSLARLYQFTDQDKKAYTQYNRILRRNPPFDLGFFSRLYLGQVTELSNNQDKDRIVKYYRKMLKDSKNAEYRDKIYYEMAQFELRQQNYDKALALLQQSLKTTGTLANQKSYSYLLAGEIYFENLNKYNLAQAYYDSAVQVFPPLAPGYEQVVQRKNILTDFVTQYNTIQTQDSLQRLAQLTEGERLAYLRQLVQREDEERLQAIARQQEKQLQQEQGNSRTINNNRNNAGFAATDNSSGGIWYFDNPAAMATARSEFARRWGDRPLQDNWRLRTRGELTDQSVTAQQENALPPVAPTQSTAEQLEAQVQSYLQNIPLTTAAMQLSEKQVEEALYNLAKIYSQKLNDPVRAAETYEQLLKRFPNSEHAPEVHYSLFLLYDKSGDDRKSVFYNKLKQQYPGTIYAKLVDDPAFMSKNAADNVHARTLYDSAYTHYEQHQYKEASSLLAQIESRYPLNDISDKAAFLGVMITARTEKPQALREHLKRFKTSHPRSPLLTKANQLLATYSDLEQQNLLRQDAPSISTPVADNSSKAISEKLTREINTMPVASASLTNKPVAPPAQPKQAAIMQPEISPPVLLPDTATDRVVPKQEPKVAEKLIEEIPAIQPIASLKTTSIEQLPAVGTMEANTLEYSTDADSLYFFVIAYPAAAAAFKDMDVKYEKYNNTYYKKQNLSIEPLKLGQDKILLVTRSFDSFKIAQDYNVKQKGPLAPVGKIRGVEFTTFVISSANYNIFLKKQDLISYLNFFRTNY